MYHIKTSTSFTICSKTWFCTVQVSFIQYIPTAKQYGTV